MIIRSARPSDIDAIVGVHIKAFPGFFLTMMGPGFLRELYRGFLVDSSSIILVAEGREILGFVVGSCAPAEFFAQLRRRRGLVFLIRALPALLTYPRLVLRKLVSALVYKGDKIDDLENGALLSSIGVLPEARGHSVGKTLLAEFQNIAFSKGRSYIYLTTDALENDAVNGFYKANGFIVESDFLQSGGRRMYRYIKVNPIFKDKIM